MEDGSEEPFPVEEKGEVIPCRGADDRKGAGTNRGEPGGSDASGD